MTWFDTIAGNQRTCSRASAMSSVMWLGAQTMHLSSDGSRPASRGGLASGVHDPLDDHRVGELDDDAVADPSCDRERLRTVAGDPHRDLRKLRPHPRELERLLVPLDLATVHELLDHPAAPLELGDTNGLVADVAHRRVAAPDSHDHAPVRDVVERRVPARENRRLACSRVGHAVPELHRRRRLHGEREERERLLPQDVRVVRPAVLEAVRLRVLDQLEEAAVRRVGENGDAEAQSHLGFSFARSEAGLSILEPHGAKRNQRGGAERGDHREREPTVTRQLERETGQRRADDDGEHGACVHQARSPHPGRPDEHAAPPRRSPRTEGPRAPARERRQRRRRATNRERARELPATFRGGRRRRSVSRSTRPARSPPAGRVTMPTRRIRPPASPAAVELAPSRSRSGTTQFPATTASPNVAACRRPIGSNRRSRTTHWPAWPTRGRPTAAMVGKRARSDKSSSTPVRRAPARGVGQRRHDHEREPAPTMVAPPYRPCSAVRPPPARTRSSPATNPAPEPSPTTARPRSASRSRHRRGGSRCRRLPPRSREARCAASRSDPRRGRMAAGPRGA